MVPPLSHLRSTSGRLARRRTAPRGGAGRGARMTAPPSPRPDDALHVARALADMLGERQGQSRRPEHPARRPRRRTAGDETGGARNAHGSGRRGCVRRRATARGGGRRAACSCASSSRRAAARSAGCSSDEAPACRRFSRVAPRFGSGAAARQTPGATATDAPRVRSGTQGRAAGDQRRPGDAPPHADRRRASGDQRRPGDAPPPADRRRAPDPTDA